jgi:hypothetical protein
VVIRIRIRIRVNVPVALAWVIRSRSRIRIRIRVDMPVALAWVIRSRIRSRLRVDVPVARCSSACEWVHGRKRQRKAYVGNWKQGSLRARGWVLLCFAFIAFPTSS